MHALEPSRSGIPQTQGSRLIQAYFRSGWVFLLPYLAEYFFYCWLRWPINPGTGSRIPPLLHVYWATHALHLTLALFALRRWFQENRPAHLWILLPWILLAVIFLLPGTYLEFPADPWEHYARMNRWQGNGVIGEGYGWYYKQGYYFFAYSVLGQFSISWQLRWLDWYQAALCLLLSFQYYRLARACRLGSGAAAILILLLPLLFGNDLWGFHRYYILSSTVFSQIAAVAAIRLAIELSDRLKRPDGQVPSSTASPAALGVMMTLAVGLSALNHVQGLAIFGLGLFAVVLRHAAKLHRHVFITLVGLLLLASAGALQWWPRHPVLNEVYRPEGWLNYWYGFDLFSPDSNAARRMLLIVGLAGVLNLAAGLVLVRRNHIAGWLTLIPVIALQLPIVSIPLANAFARSSPAGIVAFHRVFFAIPAGLALAMLGQHLLARAQQRQTASNHPPVSRLARYVPFGLVLLALGYFTLTPSGYPCYNRLWNSYAVVPSDLQMRDVLVSYYEPSGPRPNLVVASAAVSNVLQSYRPVGSLFSSQERLLHLPSPRTPAADLMRIQGFLESAPSTSPATYIPPQPYLLFTPRSDTATMTRHWNPVELPLAHTR